MGQAHGRDKSGPYYPIWIEEFNRIIAPGDLRERRMIQVDKSPDALNLVPTVIGDD
jgi:hypothetical protein